MGCSRVCTALAATMIAALPAAALAQFLPPPGAQAPVQDRWPEPPKPPQAAPAPAPAARTVAPKAAAAQAQTLPAGEEPLQSPAPAPAPAPVKKHTPPPAAATAVTCGGAFAKDTTHLKLAIKYDSRNIAFGEVDGAGGKIPASILFPNDPKRRLEVLWANEAAHSGISVIAINGKSQWSAPKGMKLGLSLAALEKANGRPFKLSGFGADGAAGVTDWQDGALLSMPGGCKIGMRLAADPKSTPDARSAVSGDKEFLSSDASVRALKPTVMEILIGY